MAYSTGVTTSPVDYLTQIETFANANGWTVATGGTGGDSPLGQVSMSSDGIFVNAIAEAASNRIRSMIATAYSSGTQFYAQSGAAGGGSSTVSTHTVLGLLSGMSSNNYYLFGNTSSPRYVHAVLEIAAGKFLHWMFGTCAKYGTFTGGGYNTCLYWDPSTNVGIHVPFAWRPAVTQCTSYLRADSLLGGGSPQWKKDLGFLMYNSGLGAQNLTPILAAPGLNNLTMRSHLLPNFLKIEQTETGGVQNNIVIGHTPDLRFISMDGRAPKDELTIGTDTWKVFPVYTKWPSPASSSNVFLIPQGSAPNSHSSLAGFAFRKF